MKLIWKKKWCNETNHFTLTVADEFLQLSKGWQPAVTIILPRDPTQEVGQPRLLWMTHPSVCKTSYTFKQQHADGKTLGTARQTTNMQINVSAGSLFLLPTLVFQLVKVFPFVLGLNFRSKNHLSCSSYKHAGKKIRSSTLREQTLWRLCIPSRTVLISMKFGWLINHKPVISLLYACFIIKAKSPLILSFDLWRLNLKVLPESTNLNELFLGPLSIFPETHLNPFITVILLTDRKTNAGCHINCPG